MLNTPSDHRVHHASNPEYLDANYGGVLIVFDRLFGTFVAERDDLRPRYGLTTPLHSYNPLYIALHEWLNLARDLAAARGCVRPPAPCSRRPGIPFILRGVHHETHPDPFRPAARAAFRLRRRSGDTAAPAASTRAPRRR